MRTGPKQTPLADELSAADVHLLQAAQQHGAARNELESKKRPLRVFLSRNWGLDEEGRDNHSRVRKLNAGLKSKGLKTWYADIVA